jgi:hypothetical protein
MTDLVEFLRARLDEDEVAASAASPGPWHVNDESDTVLAVDDIEVAEGFALSGPQLRATTAHVARHDPARVLADVEAKRLLIEHAETVSSMDGQIEGGWGTRGSVPWNEDEGIRLLRLLALPHADHPDYDESWRP